MYNTGFLSWTWIENIKINKTGYGNFLNWVNVKKKFFYNFLFLLTYMIKKLNFYKILFGKLCLNRKKNENKTEKVKRKKVYGNHFKKGKFFRVLN